MKFANFYIKAPVAMLAVELPIAPFLKEDGTYHTIPSYLETLGHTVERFTNDGTFFLKGFGFTIAGLDDMRSKIGSFGLTEGVEIFIMSEPEVQIELSKPEWQQVEEY